MEHRYVKSIFLGYVLIIFLGALILSLPICHIGELKFIDAIGLRQHIAVTRANGLASMIKQIKTYAIAHKEG